MRERDRKRKKGKGMESSLLEGELKERSGYCTWEAPSPAVKYVVIKIGGALRATRRKCKGQSVAGRIE